MVAIIGVIAIGVAIAMAGNGASLAAWGAFVCIAGAIIVMAMAADGA